MKDRRPRLLLVALLSILLLPTGCAKRQYKKGNRAMEIANATTAIYHYKRAVKKKPENVLYLSALGQAFLRDSRYKPAVKVYRRAAQLAPENLEVLTLLAFSYRKADQVDEAIEVYLRMLALQEDMRETYEKVIPLLEEREAFAKAAEATLLYSRHPDCTPERVNRAAKKYQGLGREAEAVKLFVRSLEMDEAQPDIWCMLGDLQVRSGSPRNASKSYAKARALDPGNLQATIGLALTKRKIGAMDSAMELYETVLATHPEMKEPRVALVQIYLVLGRTVQAESFAHEMLGRYPADPAIKALMGAVHLENGDWEEAIAMLNLAKSRSEREDPEVLRMLGDAYLGVKERARARQYFNRALVRDPHNGYAYYGLCRMDLQDERESMGMDRCEKAILNAPELRDAAVGVMMAFLEERERYKSALNVEAAAASATGESVGALVANPAIGGPASGTGRSGGTVRPGSSRTREASTRVRARLEEIEEARRAIEELPPENRSARDWFDLGEFCIKLDDLDAARHALSTAWKMESSSLEYRVRMAEVLMMQKRFDSALLHYQEIIKAEPGHIKARVAVIQAMLARGEPEKALEPLEELRALIPDDPKAYELSAEANYKVGEVSRAEEFERIAKQLRASTG